MQYVNQGEEEHGIFKYLLQNVLRIQVFFFKPSFCLLTYSLDPALDQMNCFIRLQ